MHSILREEIGQEQAGFKPDRDDTRDQITNLRIILDKATERNQSPYFSVDFTKAFDMVRHDHMRLAMLELCLPPHLVELWRNLYRQQRTAVRPANLLSNWFHSKKGVRK